MRLSIFNTIRLIVLLLATSITLLSCISDKRSSINVKEAYKLEANRSVMCDIYSKKALSDSLPNVSRLLSALREAEDVHSSIFDDLLDEKLVFYERFNIAESDSTLVNLYRLLSDFQYEYFNLYPEFIETAKMEGGNRVGRAFETVSEATRGQIDILLSVIDSLNVRGNDGFLDHGWVVCKKCGLISKLEPSVSDRCSNCNKNSFLVFEN